MKNLSRWLLIVILTVTSVLSFAPSVVADTPETPQTPLLGKDDFGYSWDEVKWAFDSASVADPSGPCGSDQVTGPADLGFPFKFYGRTYTQAYISTNGLISLGSAVSTHSYTPIPKITLPNAIIAPFWDFLKVTCGQIHYRQDGVAPNRKFIVEWNKVQIYYSTGVDPTAWFQATLFENGDIQMSYETIPDGLPPSVGIEDESGWYGLGDASSFLVKHWTFLFTYPAAGARLKLTPPIQHSFGQPGAAVSFSINVLNAGDNGADTFDITSITSTWPVSLYNAAGTTLLTDTDADSKVDTGSITIHADKNITVRIAVPANAIIGAGSATTIELTSSLDAAVKKTVTLRVAVPASFQQAFKDEAAATQENLELVAPSLHILKNIASPYNDPAAPSVASLNNGGSLIAWTAWRKPGDYAYTEIEYALQDRHGSTTRATSRLTDYSVAASHVTDATPAVAQAPDGKVGLLWISFQRSGDYLYYIYNVFFAVLDANGALVSGPTNLTNNTTGAYWSMTDTYATPTIAVTGDNRFVLAWAEVNHLNSYRNNLWYASRSTTGAQVTAPTNFTNNTYPSYYYTNPNLTALNQNRVLLAYHYFSAADGGNIKYQVLNSDCSSFKAATTLDHVADDRDNQPDGIRLSNGKVLIGWVTHQGVGYALLDASYNKVGASQVLTNVFPLDISDLSVTSDSASRGILTWEEADNPVDSGNVKPARPRLYYALVDGNGAVLTPPMIYRSSANGFQLTPSYGNIPLLISIPTYLPFIAR